MSTFPPACDRPQPSSGEPRGIRVHNLQQTPHVCARRLGRATESISEPRGVLAWVGELDLLTLAHLGVLGQNWHEPSEVESEQGVEPGEQFGGG